LAEVARKRRMDTSRWTLAQPRPEDLRKLAAVLDVQYRKLPDGEFNHSSVISLLDREGRVLARTSKLGGAPDPEFVAAVRRALAREPSAAGSGDPRDPADEPPDLAPDPRYVHLLRRHHQRCVLEPRERAQPQARTARR